MAAANSMTIAITADWEHLEEGSPAERACFAAIGIKVGDTWLTEAEDSFVKRIRQQVHLSAYRLAEWLAWNWWRLKWEPRGVKRSDWTSAHQLTSAGGGYVWPNLTFFSDGERLAIISRATTRRNYEPLRYLTEKMAVIGVSDFVAAVDQFIEQVLGQLSAESIESTNLAVVWSEVLEERAESDLSRWRQLEALLGYEPGDAPEDAVKSIIEGGAAVGSDGFAELAAARKDGENVPSLLHLHSIAATQGSSAKPADVVRLSGGFGPANNVPAWRRGAAAAKALRKQESLGDGRLSSLKLASLAGVESRIILQPGPGPSFSFALDDNAVSGHVVLRKTDWQTNRRFELARLLGDRIFSQKEFLLPATRAQTYRQKWQRAFAAELLCPAESLIDMVDGDVSPESIESAAEQFEVAELVVKSLLADHKLLDHESIEASAEAA
jgi:hypothetical protein